MKNEYASELDAKTMYSDSIPPSPNYSTDAARKMIDLIQSGEKHTNNLFEWRTKKHDGNRL